MSWLVLSPGAFVCEMLKLFNFQYMDFKMLLLALAALNFFLCFAVEVSDVARRTTVVPLWESSSFSKTHQFYSLYLYIFVFFFQVVIDLGVLNYLRCNANRPSKKKYKRLNSLLCNSPSWPPLNQPLLPTNHTVVSIS